MRPFRGSVFFLFFVPALEKAVARAISTSNPPIRAMAALAAVATDQGLDAVAPFPLLRLVSDYLTYDQLMPPCRLRWSRRLGRPVMENYILGIQYGDVIGAAWIEELHPYETMLVGTRMQHPFPRSVTGWSMEFREFDRDNMWDVTIVDEDYEDWPYVEAWMRRYGVTWPSVSRRNPHPTLHRLYLSYARFCERVCHHAGQRDIAFEVERDVMLGW